MMKIDDITQTLRRLAIENLVPYIELASFEGDATDPASAFFEFIVEATRQIDGTIEDCDVLECLSDAFIMFDHDLVDRLNLARYHLYSEVKDEFETPKLVVELMYADASYCGDKLMHITVDLPLIRTIIHKRARY